MTAMAELQDPLPLDAPYDPAPAAPTDLRDEIARAWGLPLGECVEISLRNESLETLTGVLQLATAPEFPWSPRQPLRLRVNGYEFDSRAIERWMRL
jgi:hypothetical protein